MTQPAKKNHLRLCCPHCESFVRIRTSRRVTPTVTDAFVECTSGDCNWRGQMTFSMNYTTTPSDQPNMSVRLPLSPRLRRQLLQAHTEYAAADKP